MTASITFGPRHPAYMAGYTWAENPTAHGCPYERGTDDYAMWQMGVEDARGREAALREAARELLAQMRAIKLYGDLACVRIDSGFGGISGGKKPPSKDVWQFPRHMLVEIDAAISKMEGVL